MTVQYSLNANSTKHNLAGLHVFKLQDRYNDDIHVHVYDHYPQDLGSGHVACLDHQIEAECIKEIVVCALVKYESLRDAEWQW